MELTTAAIAGITGVGVLVAAPFVVPAALSVVGFTGAGVAAGSVAAGIQAGIGSVAAGSAFAVAQSIGAAGIAKTTAVALGAGSSVVCGAALSYFRGGA